MSETSETLHDGNSSSDQNTTNTLFEQEVRKNITRHFQPESLEESPNVVHAIREKLGMKPPLLIIK